MTLLTYLLTYFNFGLKPELLCQTLVSAVSMVLNLKPKLKRHFMFRLNFGFKPVFGFKPRFKTLVLI